MKQLWAAVPLALLLLGCAQKAAEPTPETVLNNLPALSQLLGTPTATLPPMPTPDTAQIVRGEALYEAHCATCHGADLAGEPDWQQPNADGSFRAPPHGASGHTWHHGDGVLLEAIRLGGSRLSGQLGGASAMPAFERALSREEMLAVLAFIKQSWPEDIRLIQWEMTVQEQKSPG